MYAACIRMHKHTLFSRYFNKTDTRNSLLSFSVTKS